MKIHNKNVVEKLFTDKCNDLLNTAFNNIATIEDRAENSQRKKLTSLQKGWLAVFYLKMKKNPENYPEFQNFYATTKTFANHKPSIDHAMMVYK
jgi:hypothetical protein